MNAPDDPWIWFHAWMAEAERAQLARFDAMALATATRAGVPSVRMVLYKGVIRGGITFVTNYESRKARELEDNSRAALAIFWAELARQIRVEGSCERVTSEESDALFANRPRESQLGAWASPQSRPIKERAVLEARHAELEQTYAGKTVPRPPFWGGYRLVPDYFEFWIGRDHRLHDRVAYTREPHGWRKELLAP
jgi:pyridoxamine 5'-phosphate oxidase